MTIPCDIDFAQRYRDHVRQQNRPEKAPDYWDGRAVNMREDIFDTAYVREFLAHMRFDDCATLLDVGCGPGTIALSAAPRLERVYGLDYSPAMLAAFRDNARVRGLARATPILRGWDDDWADVPACDIVVASRSTAVPDLEAAVLKLQSKARVRVYLTYPADGDFIPAAVRAALGRPGTSLPDYLCVIGILHQVGLYAALDYLPGESRFANCSGFDDFHKKVSQSVGALTEEETTRLRACYDENRDGVAQEPMRWALFSWETRPQAPLGPHQHVTLNRR